MNILQRLEEAVRRWAQCKVFSATPLGYAATVEIVGASFSLKDHFLYRRWQSGDGWSDFTYGTLADIARLCSEDMHVALGKFPLEKNTLEIVTKITNEIA